MLNLRGAVWDMRALWPLSTTPCGVVCSAFDANIDVCATGVKYWREDYDTLYSRSQVYILGNPIVSWAALAGVGAFVAVGLWSLRHREGLKDTAPRLAAVFPAARFVAGMRARAAGGFVPWYPLAFTHCVVLCVGVTQLLLHGVRVQPPAVSRRYAASIYLPLHACAVLRVLVVGTDDRRQDGARGNQTERHHTRVRRCGVVRLLFPVGVRVQVDV